MNRAVVARLDSAGDVLIAGPAVRAVAASHDGVTFLAGPRGRAAAELLPAVDDIIEWQAPWVDFDSPELTGDHVDALAQGQGVTERDAQGKAAGEIRELLTWAVSRMRGRADDDQKEARVA